MADGAKGKSGQGCCTQSGGTACSFIDLYVQHQTGSLCDRELMIFELTFLGVSAAHFSAYSAVDVLFFNDFLFLYDFPCNSCKLIVISLIAIFIELDFFPHCRLNQPRLLHESAPAVGNAA